ncbi:hypothetical protein L9F63_010506, partial [Diploptera punctata]
IFFKYSRTDTHSQDSSAGQTHLLTDSSAGVSPSQTHILNTSAGGSPGQTHLLKTLPLAVAQDRHTFSRLFHPRCSSPMTDTHSQDSSAGGSPGQTHHSQDSSAGGSPGQTHIPQDSSAWR